MHGMVSHPRRPQSGHITCYLNRTYHVLTTTVSRDVDIRQFRLLKCALTLLESFSVY